MCECMERIPGQFVAKYKDGFKGRKVESAAFPSGFMLSGKQTYFLPLVVTAVGQKKKIEVPVLMKFCPLCGERLSDGSDDADRPAQ